MGRGWGRLCTAPSCQLLPFQLKSDPSLPKTPNLEARLKLKFFSCLPWALKGARAAFPAAAAALPGGSLFWEAQGHQGKSQAGSPALPETSPEEKFGSIPSLLCCTQAPEPSDPRGDRGSPAPSQATARRTAHPPPGLPACVGPWASLCSGPGQALTPHQELQVAGLRWKGVGVRAPQTGSQQPGQVGRRGPHYSHLSLEAHPS